MPTWIEDLLRNLFFAIDNVVYYFITLLYELLMYLANIDIFGTNDDVISAFLRRVYAILGIFMLFKVSFSILQYIVDPNSFSDQSKGMGRLLRNVIVVLALLALTPSLFSLAFDLQATILNSNIIGKLILGNSTGDAVSDDPEESINATLADDMRFLVFGSFFTVNYELIPECKDSPVLGTKAMASNTEGEGGNGTCLEQVRDLMDENSVDIYDFFRTSDTEDDREFASFGSLTALSQDNKHYFNYQYGFSTIAGGVIVVMMLAYCFDVAVRIIKLFFLEIIAPIPIVSFVDPKQGKEGMLYRWAKECGSTYASLFIRLAIIFLAFFLIDLVASMNLATDKTLYYNEDVPEGVMAVLVQVMLVFGILIFAGQAPKLIEEIFGFKSSGELGINPLKRITSSPVASAAVTGTAVAGMGLAANAGNLIAKGVKAKKMGKGGFREEFLGVKKGEFSDAEGLAKAGVFFKGAKRFASNLGSPIGGMVSGAVRGAYAGKDGKIKDSVKKTHKDTTSRRESRDARQNQSLLTRAQNKATEFVGIKNKFGAVGELDAQIKHLKERKQEAAQIQAQLRLSKADMIREKGFNYDAIKDINEGVFDYEKYKEATGNEDITQDEYNALSLADRLGIINGNLDQMTSHERDSLNELLALEKQIKDTYTHEQELNREIEDLQRVSGKSQNKDNNDNNNN